MSNNKTLKVFSSTAVAGMIAAAMMSSQAFAAVDAYSVKVGDAVYKYDKVELEKSFLDSKTGEKSALYEDFTKKLAEAKGFYGFNDNKNGLVDYSSIEAKFLEAKGAGQKFDVNAFTESKDAKVVAPKVVKKAVVKDGKVIYVDEVNTDESELKVNSIEPLNLKQVKIEFNKKVEDSDVKDDIEDVNNYTLDDKDGDEVDGDMIKEVKLDESKKFAILTFNDKVDSKGKYLIENQEKYTLTIDEDVTGNEIKKEIVFKDTKLPEIENIEVVGVDTVKVTFSEPVMPYNIEKVSDSIGKTNAVAPELDDDDFEINDGDISINKVELVNNNREANIVVGTNFKDKEEVKVRVKSSVKDYAGLTSISSPKKTIVKEDKKAPEVVGFKDIDTEERGKETYEKVTLVFDKDIKFKNMDDTEITNDSDLENYYHTSDKEGNRPKIVKVDGKELTLYFEDDTFANGTTNIYIKSGAIESRWEVENYKLSTRIEKEKDDIAPELTRVEQHEDYNNKIKIKFSEKVKTGDKTEDKSALKSKNYTLTDNKGKEWKIDKVEKDGTSEKEFIITTTKDLDEDLKYKLTVENVEDKAGNAIKKVTKEFKVKDNDAVDADDITIKVYSPGTNSQKIVVDFDTKMKMDSSRYSAKDLSKYTLVAKDKDGKGLAVFDDKTSINLSDMYKADIKNVKDGKAVEINLPSKENKDDLKDKQYKLNDLAVDKIKHEDVKLYLQIDRVEDANGNVTTRNYELPIDMNKDFLGKGEKGSITFDDDEDYVPQVKSPEEIFFSFDDKVDFNIKDIKVVAAANEEDAKKAADDLVKAANEDKDVDAVKLDNAKLLKIATHKKGDHDGNTTVTLTMDKDLKDKTYDDDDYNHIFTYDGKYLDKDGNKLDVYVFAVPTKIVNGNHVTSTKNDYDETLILGSKGMVKVEDKLAPVVKDNDRLAKGHRYGYDQENTDEVVEYSNEANNEGSIVVTFEEDIDPASVSRSSVTLNKDDFKDAKVKSVKAVGNKVVINLEKLTDGDKEIKIERGDEIILKGVRDINDNEAKELKLQVGDFDDITTRDNKKTVEDAVKGIENENVKLKFENAELPTVTANIEKDKENVKLADAIAVKDIAKELIPSKVVIGDKTINNITQNPTDEVIKSVQDAIVALVNGEEGKKTFDQITLADLKEKSIKANINGVEYTLSVAK
ncbi:Ig-like domain-containing protein [Clostridium novyi]|uniref:Ig-like domain-containing protein n=1 Tax=Clostridium novyi TaxID=1542 RepID=UPI0004D96AA9|nr:Ig-like domain-containing protein [Clostridium novyi]KEH87616.1 hypothetical protein Z967_03055 [Clostridium novyi A str. 4540]KEH94138.1 hypothetical protein Z964_01575 [Clostridium novyi A str. GD211209]